MNRRFHWTLLLVALALALAACGGATPKPRDPSPTGYNVSGIVRSFEDQTPIAGVKVILDNATTTTTDADGRWEFKNVTGTKKVEAALPDHQMCPLVIQINGSTSDVEF